LHEIVKEGLQWANIQLYSPLLVEKSKSIKNKQTTKE